MHSGYFLKPGKLLDHVLCIFGNGRRDDHISLSLAGYLPLKDMFMCVADLFEQVVDAKKSLLCGVSNILHLCADFGGNRVALMYKLASNGYGFRLWNGR